MRTAMVLVAQIPKEEASSGAPARENLVMECDFGTWQRLGCH